MVSGEGDVDWKQKFEDEHLPLLKYHDKEENWQTEYDKTIIAKTEALKLVKVALVTTKDQMFTIKMDLGTNLITYLPYDVRGNAKNGGEVHLRCLFNNDKYLGHYTDLNNKNWTMSFIEEDEDETTIGEQSLLFKDVLMFLTVIQYYIMHKKEYIKITTDNGDVLSRSDLSSNNKVMFPMIVAYRMADYDHLFL